MKYQNIIARMLALVMMLALCGCGAAEIAAVETTAPENTAEDASAAAETVAAETASLDFEAAYAAYAPDTVVFYVEGTGVTWQELFYQIAFNAAYLSSLEGKAITDWNDTCSFYLDAQGNPVTYGSVVMQNATSTLIQYHIMDNHFREEGLVLGKDALDAVDLIRQTTIDESFGGDEAAFLAYLESLYCTEEIWNWYNQVDAMYSYEGFNHFYGNMGSLISDEDVMDYAAGDEDGAWTEYVQVKLICLYEETEEVEEAAETEETSGEASAEASEEPGEEAAEETVTGEDILVQILTAEDKEAVFDELYALYNEEPQMDYFPDGRCVYQGDLNDTIYQTAVAMDAGECTLVSVEGADVIVMKLPVDPDGGVIYDTSTNTMYTLRYFAAWQAYADMTSGEDGWIATGSGTAAWAEGFENFSLDMIF